MSQRQRKTEDVKVQKVLRGLVELERYYSEHPRKLDPDELLAAKCFHCRLTQSGTLKRYCKKQLCPIHDRFPKDDSCDDDSYDKDEPISLTAGEAGILLRVYRYILDFETCECYAQ